MEVEPSRRPLSFLLRRVSNSAVAWSIALTFLRLALGLVLLPLLLRVLSENDLGMYYLFLHLNGLVVVLDLGVSPTIGRFVTYAMGGARKLSAQGVSAGGAAAEPNYPLLWELLFTARIFYRWLAFATALLLGSLGSWMVWSKAASTSSPHLTWLAWGISILAVVAESYFNFWNAYLRNINRVLAATQILMLTYALRLCLAAALLLWGGGLLSLPVASLSTSFLILVLSRKQCLRLLTVCPAPDHIDWRAHFRTIWPNGWRLGLYFAGGYLSTSANVLLCSMVFGLQATGRYGLSLQAVNIIGGMAAVWTSVKWPLIGQFIARGDLESLRKAFWPRLLLLIGSFLCLAAGLVALGPPLVHYVGHNKQMLPFTWLALLAANGFLEAQCTAWNTMISLWNRLPMLWPTLATNALSLSINVVLVHLPHAHPGYLVLGPLLAGTLFNYWFWPRYGSNLLGLSWLKFMRHGFVEKRPARRLEEVHG